jgi:hypothetical protein
MAARFKDKGGISWKVEDVRQMSSIPDNDVDVAVDKSTLDAMLWGSLWDPPDEVKDNTRRYIDEVPLLLAALYYADSLSGRSRLETWRDIRLHHVPPAAFHQALPHQGGPMGSAGP